MKTHHRAVWIVFEYRWAIRNFTETAIKSIMPSYAVLQMSRGSIPHLLSRGDERTVLRKRDLFEGSTIQEIERTRANGGYVINRDWSHNTTDFERLSPVQPCQKSRRPACNYRAKMQWSEHCRGALAEYVVNLLPPKG